MYVPFIHIINYTYFSFFVKAFRQKNPMISKLFASFNIRCCKNRLSPSPQPQNCAVREKAAGRSSPRLHPDSQTSASPEIRQAGHSPITLPPSAGAFTKIPSFRKEDGVKKLTPIPADIGTLPASAAILPQKARRTASRSGSASSERENTDQLPHAEDDRLQSFPYFWLEQDVFPQCLIDRAGKTRLRQKKNQQRPMAAF